MTATPLKGRGLPERLLSPPRREVMPFRGVCLNSIPNGTPLKELAKFQAAARSAVSCQRGLDKDTHGRNVFQSTSLSTPGTHDEGLTDISDIKPDFGDGLEQLAFHPKEEVSILKALLNRKARKPLPHVSPAKSCPVMESRTALASQQNRLLEREFLDSQSTTDFILTPARQLNLLQSRGKKPTAESLQEEGPFKKPLEKARGLFTISFVKMLLLWNYRCGF